MSEEKGGAFRALVVLGFLGFMAGSDEPGHIGHFQAAAIAIGIGFFAMVTLSIAISLEAIARRK